MKWELVEENKVMTKNVIYPFIGIEKNYDTFVDIYRKKKLNGTYKYKTIERH
jgi:hypothetical protein